MTLSHHTGFLKHKNNITLLFIVILFNITFCLSGCFSSSTTPTTSEQHRKKSPIVKNIARQELPETLSSTTSSPTAWDEIHFWQVNSEWGTLPYWGGTISSSGCGLCSYTTIINMLKGEKYTPATMLEKRGDWVGMEGFPDSSAGTLDGSTHAEWTQKTFGITVDGLDDSINNDGVKNYLKNGKSVLMICSAGTDIYRNSRGETRSSKGHFVVIYRYDEASKEFFVQDSAFNDDDAGKAVHYTEDQMQYLLSNTYHMVGYHI